MVRVTIETILDPELIEEIVRAAESLQYGTVTVEINASKDCHDIHVTDKRRVQKKNKTFS